ncbi:purine permease 3-like [Magnolia sinica]|uniref:purine permease 3-like n=1 Tax=Magnolia sinica TaxID=86752 RepID=UPI0026598949|nr:purine permease 3-like [Magnolia sinica]
MALNIESVEDGVPTTDGHNNLPTETHKRTTNWWLVMMNCALTAVGTIGGPLLLRLYYLHGGSRKWITSWLQTAGFPILIIPLSVLYKRSQARGMSFIAEPKLLASSAVLGLLIGVGNFMYSHGLSVLPVSTSSLLFATQLVFTAFFAFIIVRQRFTPYSINAVVLMTLGSVLLGIRKSGDRPPGVSNAEYMVGFVVTLGAAGLLGFVLPCIELTYAKASKAINYAVVMQFQLGVMVFATLFCTIGMVVNKDFPAIPREANQYELGQAKYYVVLVSGAIVFQMVFLGSMGLIFCTSSLFAGVVTATLLPVTEIAAVIVFSEKFTGEKGMALALCLWGFTSYFYGDYRMNKKQKEAEAESK